MEQAKFAVVSEAEANSVPYPVIFVEDDGFVRELHQSERAYLETPFNPMDGGRPYVKSSYEKKDGWGSVEGFCFRSDIPSHMIIHDAPLEDPSELSKKNLVKKQIRFAKEKGLEIIENADGTVTLRKPKR